MKYLAAGLFALFATPALAAPVLEKVAESDKQWTGIAVTDDKQVIVNYPLWSARMKFSVAKLDDKGEAKPWPDTAWNTWAEGSDFKNHFVAVQSVVRDSANNIWVLDTGNPFMKGVIRGAARLFQFDAGGRLLAQHDFTDKAIRPKSYLNDIRFDEKNGFAFLTDSGDGALIVLNLKSGAERRLLGGRAAAMAEEGIVTIVDGKPHLWKGKPAKMHADSIEYAPAEDRVYFKALTAKTLYSIPASSLRDFDMIEDVVVKSVTKIGAVGPTDGFALGPDGGIYLTPVEHNRIDVLKDGKVAAFLPEDKRIAWPDSLSVTKDGWLYFTTSRLHENDKPLEPYGIYRVKLPQ